MWFLSELPAWWVPSRSADRIPMNGRLNVGSDRGISSAMIKQILNKLSRPASKFENGPSKPARCPDDPSPPTEGHGLFNPVSYLAQLSFPSACAGPVSCMRTASLHGNCAFTFISEPLPLFHDVPSSELLNLFVTKLRLCSMVLDFADFRKNVREKNIKRQTLQELVDFIAAGSVKMSEIVVDEITKMFAANAFRPVPQLRDNTACVMNVFDVDDDDFALEPSWPHLQLVYEFFLQFITSLEIDTKVAKQYINHDFVLKILDLFDSDDARERDYVTPILHCIYRKFMVHRPFIRKAINDILYSFIFETEKHNGIAELLEVWGSIINGLAVPLKKEHNVFLVHVLIPLHKPKSLSMYHRQLSYCIMQFIQKDLVLADAVIRGLLKYWPVTNSHKETLFIGELEEVLEAAQLSEIDGCMIPMFQQVGRCLNSLHFQVAERALLFCNNDIIVNLVNQNRAVILPLIYPSLEETARSHWNQTVHSLALNARKVFLEMDQDLCNQCGLHFEEEEVMAQAYPETRKVTWQQLKGMACAGGIVNS